MGEKKEAEIHEDLRLSRETGRKATRGETSCQNGVEQV